MNIHIKCALMMLPIHWQEYLCDHYIFAQSGDIKAIEAIILNSFITICLIISLYLDVIHRQL